jgi:hypothetical protein
MTDYTPFFAASQFVPSGQPSAVAPRLPFPIACATITWPIPSTFPWGRSRARSLRICGRKRLTSILPGPDQGASLLWLDQYAQEGSFDVVIIDAAPTAETLRLLSLPDASRWWFERLFHLGQGAARMSRPATRPLLSRVPLPDEETLAAIEALFDQLAHIHFVPSRPES